MEKIARELLKIHRTHWDMVDKIEQVSPGFELPEELKVDLLDIILDLLGVPEDTSSKAIHDTPDYYCRDHFWDVYRSISEGEDDFINYVNQNVEEYKEEMYNDK